MTSTVRLDVLASEQDAARVALAVARREENDAEDAVNIAQQKEDEATEVELTKYHAYFDAFDIAFNARMHNTLTREEFKPLFLQTLVGQTAWENKTKASNDYWTCIDILDAANATLREKEDIECAATYVQQHLQYRLHNEQDLYIEAENIRIIQINNGALWKSIEDKAAIDARVIQTVISNGVLLDILDAYTKSVHDSIVAYYDEQGKHNVNVDKLYARRRNGICTTEATNSFWVTTWNIVLSQNNQESIIDKFEWMMDYMKDLTYDESMYMMTRLSHKHIPSFVGYVRSVAYDDHVDGWEYMAIFNRVIYNLPYAALTRAANQVSMFNGYRSERGLTLPVDPQCSPIGTRLAEFLSGHGMPNADENRWQNQGGCIHHEPTTIHAMPYKGNENEDVLSEMLQKQCGLSDNRIARHERESGHERTNRFEEREAQLRKMIDIETRERLKRKGSVVESIDASATNRPRK